LCLHSFKIIIKEDLKMENIYVNQNGKAADFVHGEGGAIMCIGAAVVGVAAAIVGTIGMIKDSKESKKRTKVLNDIRRENSADHAEILQKQDDLQKQSAIHKVCGMAVAVNHGAVMPVDQEALRAEVGQSAHTPQQPAPQAPFTAPAPATAPVQEPVQQATPTQQGQPVNINVATAPAQQPAPQQNGVDVNAIIAAVLNNPEYKAALNAATAAPKQEEAPAAPVEEKKEEEPKKEAPATTSNNKKK
jgi:hypothetical protein